MLPLLTVAQIPAPVKAKPKTLKELVAEEKAAKEAERKAAEEEKARREAEKAEREAARKARTEKIVAGEELTPEEAADFVTDTDSSYWAPTHVKQLGAQNYGELTQPVSSMDLKDPENITTTVEYQPESGLYIIRTRMGDMDISTPYMLTQEEYNKYAERQIMHQYWQQKMQVRHHRHEV